MSITYDIAKGTAQFSPQDTLYHQQQQQQQQGSEFTTAGRNWPRVFFLTACISMGLVMAATFLNLVTLNFGISTFFLEVYILVLCFFAITAEFRQVKCLRWIIYKWVRYLYFVTTYSGRGLLYIFIGTLVFGGSILRYVAAAVTIGLGIVMFVVNIFVTLPHYEDPEMIREEEAARRAARSGMGQAFFAPSSTTASAVGATDRFNSVVVDPTTADAAGVYRPPGINEGPNAL
ncbi:hypothetical protein DQ04_00531010 [Trypanosoma grayi]|uniref:hypothetical protein n=1 Tax=Trypanosoma grayi TaxID=71804 RepID=UPI0004F43A0D|nr:hypothetical protein DQ04_00531010 [Trypanosoma grayi]KEG14296.1 hypothetical protein DQ04_00531010 [Trypanosoma grayi]